MKKKIAPALLVCLVLLLTGCGSKETPPDNDEPQPVPIETIIAESALQYPAANSLFYYNVYDDYVAITKYLGDETLLLKDSGYVVPTDIVIPDTIDGLPVYVIGAGAFKGAALETVKITKNVVSIGSEAFSGCSKLKSVTFTDVKETNDAIAKGNGVETLGDSAFASCIELNDITLPDSLETVGRSAFAGCIKLEKINVPLYVAIIPESFCSGCENLKHIYITDSTVEIADSAFEGIAYDAYIHGGVYSQSAHYAADHFILFIINKELPTINKDSAQEIVK